MIKETKNTLTYEGCRNELSRWAKGNLLPDTVLLGVMLLIFVPLFALCIYISKNVLVLGIVFALVCTVAPIVFAFRIVVDIITIRLIKRGDFSVVEDTVCRLSKGEIPQKYSEGIASVDVIYFTKYGRYVATGMNFDLASVGDVFYLVILHAKKEKLVFAYNSMMYEYKI
jgi:hypothetical protein